MKQRAITRAYSRLLDPENPADRKILKRSTVPQKLTSLPAAPLPIIDNDGKVVGHMIGVQTRTYIPPAKGGSTIGTIRRELPPEHPNSVDHPSQKEAWHEMARAIARGIADRDWERVHGAEPGVSGGNLVEGGTDCG